MHRLRVRTCIGVWIVAALLGACEAPSGRPDDSGFDDASTGDEPIEPAEWMSGMYSTRKLNENTARLTEDGEVEHYGFLESGTFLGVLEGDDPMRRWEVVGDDEARIWPNASDSERTLWWRATATTGADGCTKVTLEHVVEGSDKSLGIGLYPGEVCVVDHGPCPPDAKLYDGAWCTGFHLEWCDEVPPGCDDDGCDCR